MKVAPGLWAALVAALKAYPHGVSLAVNLGVLLAARFGLNLTADELVAVVGAVNVGMAAFTRSSTTPNTMMKGKSG